MNLRTFDAEILIGRAVGPSPAPYIAEHAAMKAASEIFVDGIHLARERPGRPLRGCSAIPVHSTLRAALHGTGQDLGAPRGKVATRHLAHQVVHSLLIPEPSRAA